MKPLVRVASGGELSRILLALKSLLGRKGEAETLIFDEVDAGIGGRTAELVGVQLNKLSERHQVICITHLPQIACYGKWHYLVKKQAGRKRDLHDNPNADGIGALGRTGPHAGRDFHIPEGARACKRASGTEFGDGRRIT